MTYRRPLVSVAVLASFGLLAALMGFRQPAQETSPTTAPPASVAGAATQTPRIHEYLASLPEDLRIYNEHLMILASPWMDGRLPGTKGMEQAMDYVEWSFKQTGLEPPAKTSEGKPSFRQPFPLGDEKKFAQQELLLTVGDTAHTFNADKDWKFTALGSAGEASGRIVFVGYGINNPSREYMTFDDNTDLSGAIAVMLRFEPMNDDGSSRWSNQAWSPASGFQTKLRTIAERKPAGIIVVNTPGAKDDRVQSLRVAGSDIVDVPVAIITADAANTLLSHIDSDKRSMLDLRKLADEKGTIISFPNGTLSMKATVETTTIMAENVVGLLPGRGSLKEQIIVMGGHLDHLGYGDFGSRSGAGPLHPGADDNASGSAGILLLASLLKKEYASAPADQPLRSILFIAFSAEESGLNGSRYYATNPLFPSRDHVLMFNYDMIGRMVNERLSVSGSGSAKGMHEWALPIYAAAKEKYGIEVVASTESDRGGSDHASFLQVGIPALFGIIADFHDDYHTPRDVAGLINRESALKSVYLFRDLALDAAKRAERFEFDTSAGPMRGAPMRVRLGVRSAATDDDSGVRIAEVTAGGNAEKAGFKVGDKLIKWDKNPVKTREEFVGFLRTHEPGDKVQAVVVRDGEEITLFVEFPE